MRQEADAVSQFYLDCRVRNLRPDTLKSYSDRLGYLVLWAHSRDKGLLELQRGDIQNYILDVMGGVSPETVNGRLRVFRVFYNFCAFEHIIAHNPLDNIRLLKTDSLTKPILAPTELQALLDSFDRFSFHGSRGRNMTLIFLDTMCRVGELCNIRLDHISLNDGVIHLPHTKSRRDRHVPISLRTIKSLHRFITGHRKLVPGTFLFCKEDGSPLTSNLIRLLYNRKAKRLGFEIHPHKLRRTGASMAHRAGMDVALISRQLGHSEIRTTQRYLSIDDCQLKHHFELYSPVETLAKGA